MEPPPLDDVVLANYIMTADDELRPRLNLVVPNLEPGLAFGGIMTGLDIVLRLHAELAGRGPVDLRIIIAEPDQKTDCGFVAERARRSGMIGNIDYFPIAAPQFRVPVRRNDLFVTFNWWTTINTRGLVAQQAAHFGCTLRPLTYLIQEYEAQIFPFSSTHMLCREAYDRTARLWGVFNSSSLQQYFGHQGHRTERSFVFEPIISDKLRPCLDRVGNSERARRILVYGRPQIRRNCFPALLRGLRTWARQYPQYADWEVVSAGTPHKPLPLHDGRTLHSLGKLSLDDYAALLLGSSVGVSLMASPHPSYPPLEMAHMGLQTVTNRYLCKDLADFHPNILSIPSLADDELARAIAQACDRSAAAPDLSRNQDYVRDEPFGFMPDLAAGLLAELG